MALRSDEAVLGKDNSGLRVQAARAGALRSAGWVRSGWKSRVAPGRPRTPRSRRRRRGSSNWGTALDAQKAQAPGHERPRGSGTRPRRRRSQRIQRECESLDRRIAEVSASSHRVAAVGRAGAGVGAAGRSSRSSRGAALTLVAALAAGAVFSLSMAMVREARDSRFHTPDEAAALLGTPVLAVIPRMDVNLSPVARGQMVHLDPGSQASEAYRTIRLSLGVGAARGARTLLVTSPSPGEGKSTTAGNLAIALAQAGHRTLLMDCDLRKPVQHYLFDPDGTSDAPDGAGLTSVLDGRVKLRGAVVPTQVGGLYLLPCGPVPSNPAELLAGKRFEQALETLADSFDRVVIDSPALSAVSDARSLAILADATLLVLRINHSSVEMRVPRDGRAGRERRAGPRDHRQRRPHGSARAGQPAGGRRVATDYGRIGRQALGRAGCWPPAPSTQATCPPKRPATWPAWRAPWQAPVTLGNCLGGRRKSSRSRSRSGRSPPTQGRNRPSRLGAALRRRNAPTEERGVRANSKTRVDVGGGCAFRGCSVSASGPAMTGVATSTEAVAAAGRLGFYRVRRFGRHGVPGVTHRGPSRTRRRLAAMSAVRQVRAPTRGPRAVEWP